MENLLSPELISFVDAQVASGRYGSRTEVVSAALQILEERENQRDWLRREIEIGLRDSERGDVIVVESEAAHKALFAEIWQTVEERLNLENRAAAS